MMKVNESNLGYTYKKWRYVTRIAIIFHQTTNYNIQIDE